MRSGLPHAQTERSYSLLAIGAIKKGCPKVMSWNKFEGCHEND
jgi:hypothetical protein